MDFNTPIITTSPQETARLGEELGDWVAENGLRIICLYGQLGSGKTTFVQGFAKAFGITSRLLSPTFIIVRRYLQPKTPGYLYHIDLYRIEGEKDLLGLGIQEMLEDPDSVVLIEWAEKLEGLLPKNRVDVRFTVTDEEKHLLFLSSLNRRWIPAFAGMTNLFV